MLALREAGIVTKALPEPKYPQVDLFPDLAWVYNAFWRLSARRPSGMDGALRIPVSEIGAWVSLHEYSRVKGLEFLVYIERMDEAYMDFVRERREEEEGKRTKNPPKPVAKPRSVAPRDRKNPAGSQV